MKSPEVITRNPWKFEANENFARQLDQGDPLAKFRKQFILPHGINDEEALYFAGNSLGPQPFMAGEYIQEELEDWSCYAVKGHFEARHPWLPYHENLTAMSARLVGALPEEVVVMNTLTVNLHLMMVSFYRPTAKRYKIVIEQGAFPSDKYAVDSQARYHGFDPAAAVVELKPRAGEYTLKTQDIIATLDELGDSVALVMLGQVNYLTGQAFEVEQICQTAHRHGALFGLNLAHGAGNLLLNLHDWEIDFAMWCGYKYLNSGPGALSGCFIHQRHVKKSEIELPRFAGWWGHDKSSRFKMPDQFSPIPTAEGWQLSNPPIFQMAALRASLELFDKATMPVLRAKSEKLTAYLEYLLLFLVDGFVEIITPPQPEQRGCQLSFKINGDAAGLLNYLEAEGAICDLRNPDILRAAPAPLFNTFVDVYRFASLISGYAERGLHK